MTNNVVTLKIEKVIFRQDLYPRINHDPGTVQKYAEDLSVLPPIEVNQHNELIDGWHRWTAHKKANAPEISAFVTKTETEVEFLELAIERNSMHGLQLSQDDKRDMARKIYGSTAERDRDEKKRQLVKILSVSERTVRDWLSRIDKDSKAARDQRIFDMWLACFSGAEIAAETTVSEKEVGRTVSDISEALPESQKPHSLHQTNFEPPIYNVWKQQEKTPGSDHFGNSEVRWLDNLLYLYTKPFDVVIDPFAGGGSTIDICRKRLRRYYVSDRLPVVEREKEIRKIDITVDLPKPPQWKDVKLVYLDPPYWRQSLKQYSDDPSDLGNMSLEEFNVTLSGLISSFAKKITNAYIALIIQPTQWKAENREFTDHVGDMLRRVKLPVDMRFSVPYESQQCLPQMVNWAKKEKKCLVLTREIVVWKVE